MKMMMNGWMNEWKGIVEVENEEDNEKTDLGRNCVMYVLRMGVLQFTALLKKKKLFFKFIVKKILLKIQCI
jgi:hypothetical protein